MFLLRALRRSLHPRDEDGIALVLALIVLVFFSITTVAAVTVSDSSQSTAASGDSQQNAYALAEAGLNDALGTLNGQLNSDGSIKTGATDPRTAALFATPVTEQFPNLGGSVTYSGTINTTTYVWTITSTGTITTGQVPVSRRLTQLMDVQGIDQGANGNAWSRFYQDSAASCLTIYDEEFVTNVATRGNLCITDGGSVGTASGGAAPNVDVGGNISIIGAATSSGAKLPSAGTGWTNPTNVYTNNSVYATNVIAAGATGANQDTTGFGFAIPTGATINGISVSVERMASNCCTNDVQTIAVTGSPTGGTFKISATPPGGSATTSASIAYNASAATVQAALVTIYGSGNVTCSGGSFPGTAVVCTFAGADAYQPVTLMSLSSKSLTGGSSPNVTFTHTTTGSSSNGALKDSNVQLLQGGSPVGSNLASATTWGTTSSVVNYGSTSNLWGTTWTPAQVNASNFGLRFAAKNAAAVSATASIDYVSITVQYTTEPLGIGTSAQPINQLNVGGTCQLNTNTAHTPCTTADDTYASTTTVTPASSNPVFTPPVVDFSYWYANAEPGPDHFCTNPNPGITTTFFDNDHTLNGSLTLNGEMAGNQKSGTNWTYDTNTPNIDYDCQVWSIPPTGGSLLGEIAWNHTTQVMTISGSVFIDGAFRFDNDGEAIHYFGRGDLISSKEDEIDALVCAGGTGTTDATSCLTNMSSWDPSTNMMVLMSDAGASWNSHDSDDYDEYDQGGTTCSGNTPPTCYNGHTPSGFQGVMYSTGECMIHQNFQDSGPVICNSIDLEQQSGDNADTYPTFYTFPSIGNLTNGQTYSGTATSNYFQIQAGQESG